MGLVDGETLSRLIPPGGLPFDRVLEIAAALAGALAAAHEKGVIHRDLKPANVMVTNDDRVKVLDFGLAKLRRPVEPQDASALPTEPLTAEGRILGTLPYMSPEQVEGKEVDARTDIFSLGVILHVLATGERALRGESSASLAAAILKETPPAVQEVRADLPRQLGRIVRRCLQKDPEQRFQRAKDLAYQLQELQRESDSATGTPSARPTRMRRRALAALGVVAVVAVAFGLARVFRQDADGPLSPRSVRSIAVLPLANLMNDPEQDYFVDGMTEALIANLAVVGDLEVISRTSIMRYKQTDKSAPQIARELDVDALLVGSVLRADDVVRITAELIDGRSDTHLWAQAYDRPLTDILSLHSDVARDVANKIQLQLSPGRGNVEGGPVDPQAYEAYLKAKFQMEEQTPGWERTTLGLLKQALDRDPDLVAAHVALGRFYGNLAALGFARPKEVEPLALQSTLRAIELEPRSAEAHAVLSFHHLTFTLDFPAARTEVETALQLDPNSSLAHWVQAGYFMVMGRIGKALDEVRTAIRLDPLTAFYHVGEAWNLVLLGRTEEALASLERALELRPGLEWAHLIRSEVFLRLGREREAVLDFFAHLHFVPGVDTAFDEGYRAGGVEEGFARAAARIEAFASELEWFPPMGVAWAHARAGQADRAFEWLERCADVRSSLLWQLRRDLLLESLHADPRFDELAERLGLPE